MVTQYLQHLPRALSAREEVLVAIIIHLLVVITVLVTPQLPWVKARRAAAEQARVAAIERLRQQRAQQQPFMFVTPRLDTPARRPPPPQAPPSDIDREAMTRFRPENPTNRQPFARGNTAEFSEASPPQRQARAAGQPTPETNSSQAQSAQDQGKTPGQQDAVHIPDLTDRGPAFARDGAASRPARSGALGDALRNLQHYADQAAFDNPQGGNGSFGPSIQFDTKGVEFGPWIRRFIAQIKRNWFIPDAAMSLRGHTVITFNVHKDGSLTDVSIIAPSQVEGFNHAAFNALAASNPTQPLPEEYPSEKAFFTVTFYYNETPPSYSGP